MPPVVQKKKGKAFGKQGKKGAAAQNQTDNEEAPLATFVETKQIIKPDDQVQLTCEELNEEMTIILKTDRPDISYNVVDFNYEDMEFKLQPNLSNMVLLYSSSTSLIHKSVYEQEMEELRATGKRRDTGSSVGMEELDTKRKNKFNFCDRAIQTSNFRLRDQYVQLEPPQKVRFSATASLAVIHESYGIQEELRKKGSSLEIKDDESTKKKPLFVDSQVDEISKLMDTVRILERMINQNIYSDVNLDCSTWEDPRDEFMEQGKGTLLPLWKFAYNPMKNTAVTSISWNFYYTDMFIVAFGCEEFLKYKEGCICVFSLKAPSFPERIYNSPVGVNCIEFHPTQYYYFAAGFADGSVAVYDLRNKKNVPSNSSNDCRIKHNDYVTQVAWLEDNIDKQPNLSSISADGKVIQWRIVQAEMIPSEVVTVKRNDCFTIGPEGSHLETISCGTGISVNPVISQTFLVSTEEGYIHRCSALFSDQYLSSYRSHQNVIYNVEWNPFHPRVFLSCSADWTIRIWDCSINDSVFMFDLFNEVRDVRWAPFASTLFAAVTKDNKVHVFDMTMNRQQPTCSHLVHKPQKNILLTRVVFNPNRPILTVGDDRGEIYTFKLSPNLRSSLKVLETLEKPKFVANEIDKMEKVLKLAKNPEDR